MTDYIQTKWRDGSAFNHNLTSDEYFYNQIFEAVKKMFRPVHYHSSQEKHHLCLLSFQPGK